MCKFKHCAGAHACFLRDISPCPEACDAAPAMPEPSNKNHGFIDRSDLINSFDGLGRRDALENQLTQLRISSKMLRAVEVLAQRKTG